MLWLFDKRPVIKALLGSIIGVYSKPTQQTTRKGDYWTIKCIHIEAWLCLFPSLLHPIYSHSSVLIFTRAQTWYKRSHSKVEHSHCTVCVHYLSLIISLSNKKCSTLTEYDSFQHWPDKRRAHVKSMWTPCFCGGSSISMNWAQEWPKNRVNDWRASAWRYRTWGKETFTRLTIFKIHLVLNTQKMSLLIWKWTSKFPINTEETHSDAPSKSSTSKKFFTGLELHAAQ